MTPSPGWHRPWDPHPSTRSARNWHRRPTAPTFRARPVGRVSTTVRCGARGQLLALFSCRSGRRDSWTREASRRRIDRESVLAKIEQIFVPTLDPGDLVIADNLGGQQPAGVRRGIQAAGAPLWYLPRHRPHQNPTELCSRLPSGNDHSLGNVEYLQRVDHDLTAERGRRAQATPRSLATCALGSVPGSPRRLPRAPMWYRVARLKEGLKRPSVLRADALQSSVARKRPRHAEKEHSCIGQRRCRGLSVGHERTGTLPRTAKWQDILADLGVLEGEGGTTVPDIARRTLDNVRIRYRRIHADSGVQAAFTYLLALATDCYNRPETRDTTGLDLDKNPSPLRIAAGLNSWVSTHRGSIEYAELACRAGGDTNRILDSGKERPGDAFWRVDKRSSSLAGGGGRIWLL